MNFDEQSIDQLKEPVSLKHALEEFVFPNELTVPLSDQLSSINPDTRLEAINKLIQLLSHDKIPSESYFDYYRNIPKYLTDSHHAVQEKALDLIMINKLPLAADNTLSNILSIIIERCLVSNEEQLKAKSMNCLLSLAEIEFTHTMIKNCLNSALYNKTDERIAVSGLNCLIQLLKNFGNECFQVEDYVELVASFVDTTNVQMRVEVINYLKEAYRWDQTAVEKAIKNLKPDHQVELEKLLVHTGEVLKPIRFVKTKMGEDNNVEMRGQWCARINTAESFKEKTEELKRLCNINLSESVNNENFEESCNALKRLLQDSNVDVVNMTLKAIRRISLIRRETFSIYAKDLLGVIIQKYQNKKTIIEAQECMESLLASLNIDEMLTEVENVLSNQTSASKISTCLWLETFVIPKTSIYSSIEIMIKGLANDSSSDVREAALSCLTAIKAGNADEQQRNEKEDASKDIVESESKESATSKMDVNDSVSDRSACKSFSSSKEYSNTKKGTKQRHSTSSGYQSKRPHRSVKSPAKEIVEEDIGPAMTPETSTKLVYENLPSSILAQFDMINPKEKQKGLQNLTNWVQASAEKAQQVMEAIIVWLKRKLKDYVGGDYFTLITTFCYLCQIDKRFAYETVPAIVERMSDLRMIEGGTAAILSITDSVSPIYVSTLIIKGCYSSKSNNVIRGGISVLGRVLEEYGPALFPVKLAIECTKSYMTSANQLLRAEATNFIISVYKIVGSITKPLIYADVKPSIAKIFDAELAKAKFQPPFEIKRSIKGETADLAVKNKDVSLTDFIIPRVDISSQITSKILAGLTDSAIKQRQEARDSIERILVSCNNRIHASGLNLLMNTLRERMSESHKNLAKSFISLIGNLAMAMGTEFNRYCKLMLQPLMCNLSDKQAVIRSETMTTMDKIASIVGPEVVFNEIGPVLEKGNFELRNALLIWTIKNREALNKCNAKSLVKPLVAALQDNSKEIRTLAEQVLKDVLNDIGYEVLNNEVKEAKTKSYLQTILKKYKPGVTTNTNATQGYSPVVVSEEKKSKALESAINNAIIVNKKKQSIVSRSRLGLNSSLVGRPMRKRKENTFLSAIYGSTTNLQKAFETQARSKLAEFKKASKQIARASSRLLSKSGSKNSLGYSANCIYADTVVTSTLGNKEKRNQAEKSSRWSMNEIKKEYVEDLKKTLKNCLNSVVIDCMFAAESKKICHGISILCDGLKTEFSGMLDLLDLFFKWITMKLIDQANAAVIKKLFEFLDSFLKKMIQAKYQLYEFEAASIIPILCEKLSSPLSKQIKELLLLLVQLYGVESYTNCIIWALDNTRNRRTKLECLTHIKELLNKDSANEICTLKNIRELVKYVTTGDTLVTNECLEIFALMHKSLGNTLWTLIGEVSEKAKIILKKRLNPITKVTQLTIVKKDKRPATPSSNLGTSLNENMRKKSAQKQTNTHSRAEKPHMRRVESMLTSEYVASREVETQYNTKRNLDKENNVISESEKNFSLEGSTMVEKQIKSLEDILKVLENGEIARRVDALMYLNEKVVSNLEDEKECLITHSDKLLNCFSEVLKEIFSSPPQDLPIRFAKYFMTVVSKICSNRMFVSSVKESTFSVFAEQLLMKLLYDGLDKLGDSKEGDYLVKALNSTMLKIIEYYNPTSVFVVLINLFKKYRNASPMIDNIKINKLPGLIVKCMLKMIKSIEIIIDNLNVSQILLALNEYLQLNPSTSLPKSSNDDIGIRISKTIIYEFIRIKGEAIWEDYKPVELQGKPGVHIKRWINLILRSTHPISASHAPFSENVQSLKEIFKELNSETTYDKAIDDLNEFLEEHPETDLSPYFVNTSEAFQQQIMRSLEEYKEQIQADEIIHDSITESKEFSSTSMADDQMSSLSEYKSKLALLKLKFDIEKKDSKNQIQ